MQYRWHPTEATCVSNRIKNLSKKIYTARFRVIDLKLEMNSWYLKECSLAGCALNGRQVASGDRKLRLATENNLNGCPSGE